MSISGRNSARIRYPIFAALDECGGAKDEVTKAAARTKLSSIPYGDRYEFVALA
jgi:hypothetical protein